MGVLDREWSIMRDHECGPGWDWLVVVPGKENIVNLDEETARRVADDHNRVLQLRQES